MHVTVKPELLQRLPQHHKKNDIITCKVPSNWILKIVLPYNLRNARVLTLLEDTVLFHLSLYQCGS